MPTTPLATAPTPPPPELPPGEYAAYIGLDWDDAKHALALCAWGATKIETLELAHSAETLHAWLDQLGQRFHGQRVALAVEASKGAVVAALLEHPWIVIYPIHPATSRRFSTAFTPSRAKDDAPDAQTLLEILRHHRARLRALLPQDDATRRLSLLAQARSISAPSSAISSPACSKATFRKPSSSPATSGLRRWRSPFWPAGPSWPCSSAPARRASAASTPSTKSAGPSGSRRAWPRPPAHHRSHPLRSLRLARAGAAAATARAQRADP
jgi:hypothetical protein